MEATSPEATSPYPSENLAELRRRMVTAALRSGVGWDDVEDVVQEALAKLLREQPRTGAPPVQIWAFATLRDKRVEFMRARPGSASGAYRAHSLVLARTTRGAGWTSPR